MLEPGASGKDLKSITFFTACDPRLRLDVIPFLAAYAVATIIAMRSLLLGPG